MFDPLRSRFVATIGAIIGRAAKSLLPLDVLTVANVAEVSEDVTPVVSEGVEVIIIATTADNL